MRREPVLSPTAPPSSSEWIVAKFGDLNRETPQLEPGDALIFDHYLMHRTQLLSNQKGRISGEFRVTLGDYSLWNHPV